MPEIEETMEDCCGDGVIDVDSDEEIELDED